MGATTRSPNIDIPVESGTPPSFQRTLHYECGAAISSRLGRVIEAVDVLTTVE